MPPVPEDRIATRRLALRPVAPADAVDVQALAGNWDVARMLADMPHPLTLDLARQWSEAAATDHTYAITLEGRMIGGVSLCAVEQDQLSTGAELGFWLGKPWWGRGFAREAGAALIARHPRRGDGATITSGHFFDNPASARVLEVLGFVATGALSQWCLARQDAVNAVRYALPGGWIAPEAGCAIRALDDETKD